MHPLEPALKLYIIMTIASNKIDGHGLSLDLDLYTCKEGNLGLIQLRGCSCTTPNDYKQYNYVIILVNYLAVSV